MDSVKKQIEIFTIPANHATINLSNCFERPIYPNPGIYEFEGDEGGQYYLISSDVNASVWAIPKLQLIFTDITPKKVKAGDLEVTLESEAGINIEDALKLIAVVQKPELMEGKL